jgi:hypothetical protein
MSRPSVLHHAASKRILELQRIHLVQRISADISHAVFFHDHALLVTTTTVTLMKPSPPAPFQLDCFGTPDLKDKHDMQLSCLDQQMDAVLLDPQ